MLEIYLMEFTEDNGETHRTFSIPAKNLTDAYIAVQIQFPNAIITDAKVSGKIITIKDKGDLE